MFELRERRVHRLYVRRYTAVSRLTLACLSWGFSTALTKIVLEQLTPVDVFGIEILLSAIPLSSWRSCAVLVPAARTRRSSFWECSNRA